MFIFSNLAVSLDGKITSSDHKLTHLGSAEDRKQMQRLRQEADVILMGASTLRTYGKPALSAPNFPANAILSRSLEGFDEGWEFFRSKKIERLLFIAGSLSEATQKRFSSSSEIILLNPKIETEKIHEKNSLKEGQPSIARKIIQELKTRGFKRLLLEGGGELMWEFVKYNLINEYHVTLTPQLIGGRNTPTMVEGAGFPSDKIQKLNLVQSRLSGNELFLTYRR